MCKSFIPPTNEVLQGMLVENLSLTNELSHNTSFIA